MTQTEKLLALIESKDAEIRLLRQNQLDTTRWPVEWDLSETQARILTGLYAGLWHRDKLIPFVYRGNRIPRTALQIIGSRMTDLRRKVPKGVHIVGVYRFGWQVPQSSMDILTAALEKQGGGSTSQRALSQIDRQLWPLPALQARQRHQDGGGQV